MATLSELKKRLADVRLTGQLAGAMKTASAARYAKAARMLEDFSAYGAACGEIRRRFGTALAGAYPPAAPDAPVCYVLLGSNRGLCGGYNLALYEYADRILRESGGARLLVVGRHAVNRFREKGAAVDGEFTLSDTVSPSDGEGILAAAKTLYLRGEASSVVILWQRFVNMLTQTPSRHTLLPVAPEGGAEADILFLPDRETALRAAADACLRADFTAHLLEAAVGSQAATLVAMRSACDNAEQSAAELEAAFSHKRQSEVTASVIETSGGNAGR